MLTTVRRWFGFKTKNESTAPSEPTISFGDPNVIQYLADAPIQSQEVFDQDDDEIFFQGRYLSDYPSVDVLFEENRKPAFLLRQYHSAKLREEKKSYEPPNELGKTTRRD